MPTTYNGKTKAKKRRKEVRVNDFKQQTTHTYVVCWPHCAMKRTPTQHMSSHCCIGLSRFALVQQ